MGTYFHYTNTCVQLGSAIEKVQSGEATLQECAEMVRKGLIEAAGKILCIDIGNHVVDFKAMK